MTGEINTNKNAFIKLVESLDRKIEERKQKAQEPPKAPISKPIVVKVAVDTSMYPPTDLMPPMALPPLFKRNLSDDLGDSEFINQRLTQARPMVQRLSGTNTAPRISNHHVTFSNSATNKKFAIPKKSRRGNFI